MKQEYFTVIQCALRFNQDFGQIWFGSPCSENYSQKLNSISLRLKELNEDGMPYEEAEQVAESISMTMSDIFMHELSNIFQTNKNAPSNFVKYIIESSERSRQDGLYFGFIKPAQIPTRLIHIGKAFDSCDTVELYLDKGWQFNFQMRCINMECNPTIYMSIQIVGMPTRECAA